MGLETIKAWLAELRPREREVIALRFCADLSTADIAACMGLSEPNVRQISSRALRRLRRTIVEGDGGEAEQVAGGG